MEHLHRIKPESLCALQRGQATGKIGHAFEKGHINKEYMCVRRNYWLGVPTTALGAIAGAVLIKSRLNTCHGFRAPSIISLFSYVQFYGRLRQYFHLVPQEFYPHEA